MKKRLIALVILISLVAVGCDYYELESKTMIDYRHTQAHQEIDGNGDKAYYNYYPEKFEIRYEYTYKDGHKKRYWEDCTRFEYQDAVKELGGEE